MPSFNLGDRVVCEGTRRGERKGEVGTVVGRARSVGGDDLVRVKFDRDGHTLELFPQRFRLDDGVSSVCRKIRQMEHRWVTFQERKANGMV